MSAAGIASRAPTLSPPTARANARCAARRTPGSVATRGQLARIGTSEWLPAGAGASIATAARRWAGLSRTPAQAGSPRGIAARQPGPRTGNITEEARSMLRGVLGFLPLVLDLAGPFLVLPLTALASRLAFLPTPMTGSLVSCGTSAATYGPRSRPSCRRRGAPVTPCSTPDEAQTFQISRRELFSHLRRRASARLAPDPEGRTRQRQAAIDRSNAGHPNEDRRPARRWPGRYSRTPRSGRRCWCRAEESQEYRSAGLRAVTPAACDPAR